MPRDLQILIFVGIKDSVIALDDRTGTEVWRAELRSSDYVNVYFDGETQRRPPRRVADHPAAQR